MSFFSSSKIFGSKYHETGKWQVAGLTCRRLATSAMRCEAPRKTVSYQTMSQPSGPTFEKALAELEKIVARMESGELSLEEALATHKRGLELARFCQQKLEAAQEQVKVLEGDILKPLERVERAAADRDEREGD